MSSPRLPQSGPTTSSSTAPLKGSSQVLRIAAGNVRNLVDLRTSGYGTTLLDGLNGGQIPTLTRSFGW
jgi:hypothetical protein